MAKHFRMQMEYLKIAIHTALEYRTNFLIQVISMFLNDVVWVVFWLIFFTRFQTVNGWNFQDMLVLYTVITIAFGLSGVFFGNRAAIAGMIVEGKLDYYLTLPKNILYHVLVSRVSWFDLGDIVFGVVLALFFVPPIKWPLLLILTILSMIIIVAFGVIVGSLAFFMGNAEDFSKKFFDGLIGFASYPLTIYRGFIRFLVLVIVPAGFVTGIPVMLLKEFNWQMFFLMVGFTVLISVIAIGVFYWGLKRYESGNLMNVRT
ncbi:MAG: ABC-2 family transporter protein [Candidatus Woesearchaeota archaeon]